MRTSYSCSVAPWCSIGCLGQFCGICIPLVATEYLFTWKQKCIAVLVNFVFSVWAGDEYLVAGTDGVGTKLKLAFETGIHDTIGIDLVWISLAFHTCCSPRFLGDNSVKVFDPSPAGCYECQWHYNFGRETIVLPGLLCDEQARCWPCREGTVSIDVAHRML